MPDRPTPHEDGSDTAGAAYAARLLHRERATWKRLLDVQRPYRWNLHRLELGRVLDVGCGIGRNLKSLGPDSVGVDHNQEAVALARASGLSAYTPEDFWSAGPHEPAAFDSMLLAHVVEHVSANVAEDIVREYLPCLRPGGRVVFITPQEAGFRSDPTHVRFVDLGGLRAHADTLDFSVERAYSFPFPRPMGKMFKYNEFVLVACTR